MLLPTFGVVNTICMLNHYTAGGILFGDRTELPKGNVCGLCVYVFCACVCAW